MKKKKICVVTGSRADFGVVYPVMHEIQKSEDLELATIATCMHLSPEFGSTVKEVERHGFKIDARVDMLLAGDGNAAMAKSLGIGIYGIAQALEAIAPDFVLIPTDRAEHLAGAAAAATMNLLVAHMNGGDVSGSIDESYRHAITKFSHLHFPNCRSSAERLIKLGERPERVYCVGDAALDAVRILGLKSKEAIRKEYELPETSPFVLAVFHPVSSESQTAEEQMSTFLNSLAETKLPVLLLSPNADAGGRSMIGHLKTWLSQNPQVHFHTSLPHTDYLSLLQAGNVLVGNSSSGILEAPFFGLPVVNLGSRQQGRERAGNVLDVPVNKGEILAAIEKSLYDQTFQKACREVVSPYGDGHASKRIVEVFRQIDPKTEPTQKRINY